jgi:hypothetical protein
MHELIMADKWKVSGSMSTRTSKKERNYFDLLSTYFSWSFVFNNILERYGDLSISSAPLW